ncbi:MAG: NAD-dependent epimerase/dehydratase family protein [Clostridia bacterium]|nr:NAD-dependent epimerase/dehydratase family protein [Clostridia bacterium]
MDKKNNNKKNTMYLVTGAAGFLGGTVARQLVDRGEHVRAFVLPNDKAMKFVPREAEIVEGDLRDKTSLQRFFCIPEGMDFYVIHCASIVTVNPEYNQRVMDVNVGGTQNIIDFCLGTPGFQKLVYVSSTGAIPELPKGQVISEVNHFNPKAMPDQVLGCYSQSKALATQAVLDACTDRGLNASVVHPSGIMGPEDFAVGETTSVLIQIINGEMPMGIAGSFNLCDVRDLAAGCIAAIEKGKCGECYILGNKEVQFRDFATMVAEVSGCKPVKMFLPCGIANFIAKIMEKKAKKNGTRPLMTTFSVYNLARNNNYDSGKAARELGYTTRSYKETMTDEVNWLKETGKIDGNMISVKKEAMA